LERADCKFAAASARGSDPFLFLIILIFVFIPENGTHAAWLLVEFGRGMKTKMRMMRKRLSVMPGSPPPKKSLRSFAFFAAFAFKFLRTFFRRRLRLWTNPGVFQEGFLL